MRTEEVGRLFCFSWYPASSCLDSSTKTKHFLSWRAKAITAEWKPENLKENKASPSKNQHQSPHFLIFSCRVSVVFLEHNIVFGRKWVFTILVNPAGNECERKRFGPNDSARMKKCRKWHARSAEWTTRKTLSLFWRVSWLTEIKRK